MYIYVLDYRQWWHDLGGARSRSWYTDDEILENGIFCLLKT